MPGHLYFFKVPITDSDSQNSVLKITGLELCVISFEGTQIVAYFCYSLLCLELKRSMRRTRKKITRDIIWFGEHGSYWAHQARELTVEPSERGA